MKTTLRVVTVLAFVLGCGGMAAGVTACSSSGSGGGTSSSSSGGSGSGSGGGSGSGSGGVSGGSSGGSSGSSSGGVTAIGDAGVSDSGSCASQGTNCDMCCYNAHTTGGDMLNNAYYSCICTTAHCSTQCALTDCSQSPDAGFPQMGDPCDLCEQMYAPDDGGGVCGVTPDCAGNADCLAYAACENTCTQ